MDQTFTDENGQFFVDGQSDEATWIDPVLYISHDCGDCNSVCYFPPTTQKCRKKWKVYLPKTYISKPGENISNKTYDIGTYNLEIHWRNEYRRCELTVEG